VRSAARRTKQISRYRHQRVTIEPDAQSQAANDDSDEGPEKIEVHVHVHRGAAGQPQIRRPKAPPPRAELTGTLFDWKGHYDVVCAAPPEQTLKGLARLKTCHSCYQPVSVFAERCARCSTPRSRRPVVTAIAASTLVGLAVVLGVFLHLFGSGTIAEHVSLSPLRQYSDDDYYYEVVEVPAAPSPFGTSAPAATKGSSLSNDHLSVY
jgi:hypothetical protein